MQIRRKFLFEFLLSIGLVFSLSQFLFTQTFFAEERLQSVALVALLLSILLVILTFFRYGYLILQSRISNHFTSDDARTVDVRIPVAVENIGLAVRKMPAEWKMITMDPEQGYVRFRRPINAQSWGEIVEIQYEPLDETASWVSIKSSSIDPLSKKNSNVNLKNIQTAEQILQRAA